MGSLPKMYQTRGRFRCLAMCLAAAVACLSASSRAQTTWVGATGGQWDDPLNWIPEVVPNEVDAFASFPSATTVNLAGFTATVGTIAATQSSGNVVLGSTATVDDVLTLATSFGEPTINVATGSAAVFMYANVEGTQGLTKTGPGRLTFRFNPAEQTYTGPIAINGGVFGINQDSSLGNVENDITIGTGARLLAEPGSNSGTITLPASRTITLAGAQSQMGAGNANVTFVVAGDIVESGPGNGFVKTDAGVVELAGTLGYTGETRIAGGTLRLSGPALLPSGGNVRFTQPAAVTLDIGTSSQTVRTIVMDNTAANRTITGGGSLTVNGEANLQLNASNGVTYSFAGLENFAFDRSTNAFAMRTVNVAGVTTLADVNLASAGAGGGTNTITASEIVVGGSTTNIGNNGNTARLHLGTTNLFQSPKFQLGGYNAGGVVDFQAGLTNPSLVLRGADGSSPMADWIVGETSSGNRRGEGVVDLTGGSLDALVTTLTIGRHIAGAPLPETSSVTMPAGTLVATTIVLGEKTGSGIPIQTDTFNQSGGTVAARTITFGDNQSTAEGVPTFRASWNLSGGTLRAGTIAAGGGIVDPASVRTINWTGGEIANYDADTDLTISGTGPDADLMRIDTSGGSGLTFRADADRRITIGPNATLGGSGGITKAGPGTLLVGVDATYTDSTTVEAGTLMVNGAVSGTSGVAVLSGGTLAGSGSVTTATVVAGATVAPGDGIGTLTTTGAVLWGGGGNYNWQLTDAAGVAGTGWDLLSVGGSLDIAASSGNPYKINLWTLSSTNPDVSGPAANFSSASPATWTIASAAGGISGFTPAGFQVVTSASNGTAGFANNLGGGTFAVAQSGNDLQLVFTPGSSPSDIVINVASGTQTQGQVGYPVIDSATSVTKTGAGTVVFDAANAYTGPTTVSAGTLEVANANGLSATAVTVQPGGLLAVASGTTMKSPAVTVAGGTLSATTLAVNASTGIAALTVSSGTLAGAAAVTVDGGGTMALSQASRVTVGVGSLSVAEAAGGGQVNVGSGQITIAAGGITEAALRADLIAGRNGGAWNGQTGIMTSAAAGGTRGVGYVINTNGSARVSFAAAGDVDLGGSVDVFDLVSINSSGAYGTGVTSSWSKGDFNYDGVTNVFDLVAINGGGVYGKGNYFPAAPTGAGGLAAVPEPAHLSLLMAAAGVAVAAARRRR
jgi:autotransporter-associated beta strand protein